MATDYIFLKGKASWVRNTSLNEWGKWSMMLHPDNESLEVIRDLQTQGVKNVLSKDENGYFVRLTRPSEIKIKGQMRGLTAPEIFDGSKPVKDDTGNIIGFMPLNELIGNGSDAVVKMEVYSHGVPGQPGKKSKAMRWLSTRVDSLIPYTLKRDASDNERNAQEGMAKVAKQLF